mmetsp:Transcript_25928/g.65364  ORF Transcript_25928/g.65364 Transcript_25928/m.65364 type:complete len:1522 (+) Transcript_25928:157-4722(+)
MMGVGQDGRAGATTSASPQRGTSNAPAGGQQPQGPTKGAAAGAFLRDSQQWWEQRQDRIHAHERTLQRYTSQMGGQGGAVRMDHDRVDVVGGAAGDPNAASSTSTFTTTTKGAPLLASGAPSASSSSAASSRKDRFLQGLTRHARRKQFDYDAAEELEHKYLYYGSNTDSKSNTPSSTAVVLDHLSSKNQKPAFDTFLGHRPNVYDGDYSPKVQRYKHAEKHRRQAIDILEETKFMTSEERRALAAKFGGGGGEPSSSSGFNTSAGGVPPAGTSFDSFHNGDAALVQQLVDEVWSLEAALRTTEAQITQMLDNEPRLAFLADIEREAGEKSKQMKTLLEQVTALKQENAKVVADLGESEQHAKNYMEKMNDMDNHNAELDEQLRNLAQRVATAEADHQREVQKLRNDHQLAVMELDQQHASVHRDHEQKVLEMHTLLAKSNAENQSLLTKMQEQHQSELSQLRSEHQQERLSLMEWNRNALLDVETDKHKAILSMGKLHEEGLTKEMTGLKDTIAAQEATILNDSVVKKELERELEKYKHVATDYEAATEQMRADAKKEAAEEVFSLRSQLQAAEALTKTRESEKADLETRLQDTLAELAKETEKLRSSSREQLADADKKRKEALEELKAEYEEKIEQLTADHEAEIAATQKKLEEQSGKLRKTRTNLETTESEMKKSLHDQFNAEFEKQERDFAQQMEKLEREKELYEKRQATLLAQHNEKCWRLFTFGVRFKSLGTLAQNDMQSMIGIIVRYKRNMRKLTKGAASSTSGSAPTEAANTNTADADVAAVAAGALAATAPTGATPANTATATKAVPDEKNPQEQAPAAVQPPQQPGTAATAANRNSMGFGSALFGYSEDELHEDVDDLSGVDHFFPTNVDGFNSMQMGRKNYEGDHHHAATSGNLLASSSGSGYSYYGSSSSSSSSSGGVSNVNSRTSSRGMAPVVVPASELAAATSPRPFSLRDLLAQEQQNRNSFSSSSSTTSQQQQNSQQQRAPVHFEPRTRRTSVGRSSSGGQKDHQSRSKIMKGLYYDYKEVAFEDTLRARQKKSRKPDPFSTGASMASMAAASSSSSGAASCSSSSSRPTPQRGRPREQKAMQDMRERPPWVNVNESAVDTTASATTSSASRAPVPPPGSSGASATATAALLPLCTELQLPADDLHLGIWKEMQHWRQSIAQPLEDQFFGLSQPEWASPHSRKLINSLWQQACQTLKVLHGKWVAAVSSAFDSQGSAFLHQLKTERARMEHLYDKTWREKILPQGTGTRPHDHVQNRNGGSKLRQPATLLPSTSAESSFSLDELHARLEALPAPRMKDRRDAQYRKIQQRNILELWRDAVLLQPAVVDLVAEIKADVDRGVPASSGSCTSKALAARSRMYSLSKPMGRAIEKLVFTAASGRSSRTTRACNLDDVARCCLVVPDLDGIGRVIEYLERAQASGTVSTFFVKDRMSSPAPAVASCSAAGAGAGGDAKKWRDVLLYCAFNKKVDVLFELQLILSPMAAVDQRHGEFFDSARFFDEALAL